MRWGAATGIGLGRNSMGGCRPPIKLRLSKFKRPVTNLGIRYPLECPKRKPTRERRNGIDIVTVGPSRPTGTTINLRTRSHVIWKKRPFHPSRRRKHGRLLDDPLSISTLHALLIQPPTNRLTEPKLRQFSFVSDFLAVDGCAARPYRPSPTGKSARTQHSLTSKQTVFGPRLTGMQKMGQQRWGAIQRGRRRPEAYARLMDGLYRLSAIQIMKGAPARLEVGDQRRSNGHGWPPTVILWAAQKAISVLSS